ncbi:MAG: S41 family peptidase [Planctomycetota bacterium]
MLRILSARLLFGLSLLATATPAAAQELAGKVATLLAQADAAPLDRAFDFGLQILDTTDDERTDPLRDAIVQSAQAVGDHGRIAAAVAMQKLKADATYGKDILELLQPVSTSSKAEARAAAMALLGEERYFNTRILPDVRKVLEDNCKDELVPAQVRIEAAVALWHVGQSAQRATAKAALEQFLRSTDRELRVRGALALAELNVAAGEAWGILRDIQLEPNDLGRRARLFLKREEERREFEAMLSKLVEQKNRPDQIDTDDEYRVLTELRQRVHANHVNGSQVKDDELIEYAAKGMLQGLDPHSVFFTSDEFRRFFFDLHPEYGGIGAFVNFDQDNDFSIIRPIYSGPAYSAGLRSGDKILEVDGWETAGHTSEDIIARLKGRPETPVALKVFRPGWQEAESMTIVRRQITVPSVNHTMLPGKIGYIELVTFGAATSEEMEVALRSVMQQGAVGIALDVRNNTGGFLTQARDVVEKFVAGDKLVVYTEGPSEPRRNYKTRNSVICDLPLAVLTNNLSASASEITAGALQDLGRATIVGQRTFGKGTVQNMMALASDPGERFEDLNDDGSWQEGEPYTDGNKNGKFDVGAHIKLTVAKYYLPSGRSTHREFDKDGKIVDPSWGVTPEFEIELLEQKPEDAWKNSAVFALLKKGVFREYVKKHLKDSVDLFRQLAEGDEGDHTRYPEFDAFYKGLDTKLSEDDVRRWIRYEVRDQISDLRGATYPGQRALGDPQEDAQLQEAVRQLLKKWGQDIREIPAYKNVLKISFDENKAAATGAEPHK